MAAHIGMDSHREAEFIVIPVEVVEMISPEIFNVSRVDPAMRVGRLLDELPDM